MNRSNKIWTAWLVILAIAAMAATHVAMAAEPAKSLSGTDALAPAPAAATAPAAPGADATAAGTPGEPATDAQAPVAAPDTRALDEEIQSIKKDVVDLNRDLFVLEEELLFPANTQVAVFLSMDVGEFFALDTVELRVDDKQVTKYLYTPREAEALLKGGVQRLYLGNLRVGNHELVALFTGKGPNGQDYSRGAQLKFEKAVGAKYLELKISDRQRKRQPEFEIKDWE
ncbi:MAG TPA: hypothetical protein VN645_05445 [Steroidobacteraceae bacterium]|nr:hypothetical protein [Steroidobacteraceae bacterium]